MGRSALGLLGAGLAATCILWTGPLHAAPSDLQVFTDRQHYSSVLQPQGTSR
jgi:hypothetical protein